MPSFNIGDVVEVRVKPGARRDEVVFVEGRFLVSTVARAVDNQANEAVVKLMKKQMGLRVEFVRGLKSRVKFLRVL